MENNHLSIVKKVFNKKKEITTKLGKKITIRSVKDYDDYKNKKYELKKQKEKLIIGRILAYGLAIFLIPIPWMAHDQKMMEYEKVLNQNYEIVEDYNEYNEYYSEYFNNLGIEDTLEMIFKVLYDMRDEISNYDINAGSNYNKAYRLAYTYKDGKGVCKHLADDLTARLNAIYPNLNARNLVVHDNYSEKNLVTSVVGNHMVTIINPPGDDITIVIDPTNVAIGVIINGEIKMFWKDKIITYDYKPVGQAFTDFSTSTNNINYEIFKSLINYKSNEEITKIIDKYGYNAQKEAYQKILQYKSPKEKKERK